MAPLHDIASKHEGQLLRLKLWQETGKTADEQCLKILQSPAVLKAPLPELTFHLETDVSEVGYGDASFQLDPITVEKRYVEFFGGSFKGASRCVQYPEKRVGGDLKRDETRQVFFTWQAISDLD